MPLLTYKNFVIEAPKTPEERLLGLCVWINERHANVVEY